MNDKQKQFLTVLEQSTSLRKALQASGITRKQFYDWVHDDVVFTKAVAHSEVGAEIVAKDVLFMKVLKGDMAAMRLFFEQQEDDEDMSYIDRQLEMLRNLK
jgi:hypothetical protein